MSLSVQTILDLYLDLLHLSPKENWSVTNFEKNPPRLVRFQQLEILCKLYNIELRQNDNDHSLILPKDLTYSNAKIVELMAPFMQQATVEKLLEYNAQIRALDFQQTFETLLEDKIRWSNYTRSHAGVSEAYGLYLFPIIINQTVSNHSQEIMSQVDALMCYMMNPEEVVYDAKWLNETHNYPLVDLIDLDWW